MITKEWFIVSIEIEHELFELYFIKDGSEFMYGKGSKEHIAELLNDWIGVHGIYEQDSVTFRVDRKTYVTKCF